MMTLCDVGPRDGLQNESAVLGPAVRPDLVNRLAAAGLPAFDLVHFLHGEGVETGVDLDALIAVTAWLEGVLGRELPGQLYRAGAVPPVSG
jgi:isopropylmalate/homocitrate/citramalate synthase